MTARRNQHGPDEGDHRKECQHGEGIRRDDREEFEDRVVQSIHGMFWAPEIERRGGLEAVGGSLWAGSSRRAGDHEHGDEVAQGISASLPCPTSG
jgi:hypothetical protein